MQLTRSAGMLLHVTSLPGKFGIGDLGPAAYQFVNFLESAGQSVWQILPLCPPSAANSPYSSYSAFAGNTLLISPELLVETGWLASETLDALAAEFQVASLSEPSKVDYGTVEQFNRRVLAESFQQSRERVLKSDAFTSFTQQQSWWLNEFVLYEAMREHFGTGDWTKWPRECRNPSTVPASLLVELDDAIAFAEFKQFLFDQQWGRLKDQANQQGVSICGDMPIFVALESADVWANQSQFLLDADGRPTVVAGVPPDYFSETGQLWGKKTLTGGG
jgi:4-alpha-glucanotransferase